MALDGVENVCLNRFKRIGSQYLDRVDAGFIILDGLEVAVCDNNAGDPERGLRLARHALKLEPEEPTVLFNSACTFAQAGLIDEALDHLESGLLRGFGHRKWIENDSDLDPLRDEPRYKSLMDGLANRT